jgi:hypothetical protein
VGILFKTMNEGEGVQIGDGVAIRVERKEGRAVRLAIATTTYLPITALPTGLFPSAFTTGLSGRSQRLEVVPDPERAKAFVSA